MTSTLEDQQQPKVSKEPLASWEINLLTHLLHEFNRHHDEKECRHNVKDFAKQMAQAFGEAEQ